jgi:hypothetical protein
MSNLIRLIRRHSHLVMLLITGLLVPLITELAASWLQETLGSTPARLIQILAGLVAVAVVLWVLYLALNRRPEMVELVPEEERPARFPGLIVLVGTRKDKDPDELSHTPAIVYHLEQEDAGGEPLRACWLIASGGVGGSLSVARAVRARYSDRCQMHVCEIADPFGVQDTYRTVRRIYEHEAGQDGLAPEQVIADFTGGTTPMSAGMVLACRDRWPMQYMFGRPDEIVSTPKRVRFEIE